MTKYPKPGQYCSVNGSVYRAVKRTTIGCQGCCLYDILLCPGVIDSRSGEKQIDCAKYNIVLKPISGT